MLALIAQEITNPVVSSRFGQGAPSVAFTNMIVTVWRTAIVLGGLGLLVMIVLGGFEWVTAGGDKGKIEHARDRITQSMIGMLVLIGTIAISSFIGNAFGINLLKLSLPNNITAPNSLPQQFNPLNPGSGNTTL